MPPLVPSARATCYARVIEVRKNNVNENRKEQCFGDVVACCSLFVVRCLLFVVCCSLFVVCCSLFVVCCLLLLFVCCLLLLLQNRTGENKSERKREEGRAVTALAVVVPGS